MRLIRLSRACAAIALVAAVFHAPPTSAQAVRVAGTVTDSAGHPLQRAQVWVKGTRAGALTDSLGGYSLSTDRPAGDTLTMIAQLIGYAAEERRLRLPPGAGTVRADFALPPLRIFIEDRARPGPASDSIVRLPPSSFPELPEPVRAELDRLGCRVPQTWFWTAPHNVVRGRFAAPDQEDWAVLCSRDGRSEIRVFWGGPAGCAAVIPTAAESQGRARDDAWLQAIGDGPNGYSRAVRVVGEAFIHRMREAFGARRPSRIQHEGLNEAFVEKASTVWYCHHGEWLALTGMD